MAKLPSSEEAKLQVKRADPGDKKGAIFVSIFFVCLFSIPHILLHYKILKVLCPKDFPFFSPLVVT